MIKINNSAILIFVISIIWGLLIICNAGICQITESTKDKPDKIVKQKLIQTNNQEESLGLEKINKNNKSKEPSLVDIISSLVVVILLIVITAAIYAKINKINPNRLLSGKFDNLEKNQINMMSTVNIGQGKAIHLIKVNKRLLVVGSSASNINLIADITEDEDNQNISNDTNTLSSEEKITENVDLNNTKKDYLTGYTDLHKDYLS